MNRFLAVLLMASPLVFNTQILLADDACPASGDATGAENCQHPKWRKEAAYSDHSDVRLSSLGENTERQLMSEKVTLWSLPSLPLVEEQGYSNDDLEQVKVNISSAHFHSASADFDPEKVDRIEKLLEHLHDKKDLSLTVVGHTDNQLLSLKAQRWHKDNQQLSLARAQAVALFIKQQLNLSDEAISAVGKGSKEPIASNATPQGMAKNRRVEILLTYRQADVPVNSHSTGMAMNRQLICQGDAKPRTVSAEGFNISIDGEPLDQSTKDGENTQRCTDVELSKANIRMQYDNLSAQPMLDVSAWPATFTPGQRVKFTGYSNYFAWIARAEVRVFSDNASSLGKPLAVISLNDALEGQWVAPTEHALKLHYRLRVYDNEGRFDETTSLPLWQVIEHKIPVDDQLSATQGELIAYGKSRLEKQTIPVQGGTVTVSGDTVPSGHAVYFMGTQIPVDKNRQFVAQQIVPNGHHTIEVATLDEQKNGALYWRQIEFKTQDWFYVGLADITAGSYKADSNAALVTKDEQHLNDHSFIDGRLAFYTKGKWRNKYTVTASADTREQALNDIFSTIMDKDPRSLLRRLDDSAYYPTYGDDSTLIEDAPTQGKFYAKIEDERSHAMWGNFKIVQQETDLAQINRGLYGAVVDWNSASFNTQSESNTHLNVFAAEPGTQATREEFRGTGGSLYYLEHQDIVTGSERIQVEVRDKDSGIVVSVNTLVAGQDYQEDAIQGRILLTRPLPSTADDSQLVRAGSYSGHPVYLVVDYEYVGNLTDFSDLAVGGRGTHWISDSVRLGVTGSHQQRFQDDQNLAGIDVLYRHTPETYIRLEAVKTEGPGVSASSSLDGGLSFSPTGISTVNNQSANAYQLESGFQLTDLGFETDGNGGVYLRNRQKYFSAPGQLTNVDTRQLGGNLSVPLGDSDDLNLKIDITRQNDGIDHEVGEANLRHRIDDMWSLGAGLRAESREDNAGIVTSSNHNSGNRADLALQLDYGFDQDWGIYGFGQGTILRTGDRNDNNRGGLGGHYQLNDRVGLKGEASSGSGGFGALLGGDYRLSDRTTTYINYALDPDNANTGIGNRQGKLVSGVRSRYSDWVSVYGEEQLLHGDSGDGLTHAYGVDLTPSEQWSFGLAIENGRINTETSEVKRQAASLSADYVYDDIKYGGNLEFRRDDSDGTVRRNWLVRNHLAYMMNPDWRMRLQLDLALSDSSDGSTFDADFVEAIMGYAYRPIDNDHFNALIEYKYLADQAPSDQFTASGLQNELEQRSHVLAFDATYDLTPRWSIGGKYATRIGEIRTGRGTGDWFKSTAQLGIVRLDWHVIRHWDALIEARILDVKEAQDRKTGFLTAIYRHFGDNAKAGIGYNFTDFSDDLTNLDYDSHGVFFNVIGKW